MSLSYIFPSSLTNYSLLKQLPSLLKQQEEENRKRQIVEARQKREAAERERADRLLQQRADLMAQQQADTQPQDSQENMFKQLQARQKRPAEPVPAVVPPSAAPKRYATALYDYVGTEVANALNFKTGNRVELLDCDAQVAASGWLLGRLGGREGLFPASYVKQ